MDKLRTPFIRYIPQAFIYHDKQGQEQLTGNYVNVIKHFAQRNQLKFEWLPLSNYSIAMVQQQIQEGYYNLSVNGAVYRTPSSKEAYSYPLELSRVCIMVPAEDELPQYWYIIWPFGRFIWITLAVLLIYVALAMTFLQHPSASFGKNLLYSLAILQYSSNAMLTNVGSSLRLMLFYFVLIIQGFVLSSYYYSYLPAYNIRPIFQPFMKTVSELLEANLKVLVTPFDLYDLRSNEYVDLSSLEPLLVVTPHSEIIAKVKEVNRSFGYVLSQTQWNFYNMLQRDLIQPSFKLSNICFGDMFISYPIKSKWHLASALDRFILQIKQSGIWQQWQEEAIRTALSEKYYTIPLDEYPVTPLDLAAFCIAWIVLLVGSFVSFACMLLELFWNRWQVGKTDCNLIVFM